MRFAKAILEFLKANQVKYIFGIPAGTVSPLYDAINDVDIQPIVAKNEGGAAYMAARYASVTGALGVCMGAGGVGAGNMINGIADAMRAKAPMLVITGYVHRWQIGKGAIQELDTQEILRPVTKYSKTLLDETAILSELAKAVELAYTIPMGPVHLSIPIDIQLMECEMELPAPLAYNTGESTIDIKVLEDAAQMISLAKHGLILAGKGCRHKSELVMALSEHLQWPVITTPEGKGVISSEFPLNLGNYGFASTDAAAEYAISKEVECLLVIGTSLGENATSNFSDTLFGGKKTIHIDWDKRELNKVFPTDVTIHSDMRTVIPYLIEHTEKNTQVNYQRPVLNHPVVRNNTGISLREFMEKIPEYLPKDTYYVSDLGEFMNFIFKYLSIPEGGDFEINLNYAAMGSGIAGSIGVQTAFPGRPVAVFAGDGSFFMNGTEILTAKEFNLPIIYFIINNAMLGFVEHGHQYLFGRVVEGFKQERIHISDMMNAAGVPSMQIASLEEIEGIKDFIQSRKGPVVIEIITDGSEAAPNGDRLKALQKQ